MTNTDKLQAQVAGLTADYMSLIATDHHKDNDCHWSIETRWSYGKPPVFVVRHDGYISSDVKIICDSYVSALVALRDELISAVQTERFYREQVRGYEL